MGDFDSIVREVLAGNREAYRGVVERCDVPVRAVLAAMLPDGARIGDLVHEVFITAYVKLRDYRPGTDFLAWIKTIARNLAHNERRRHMREWSFKRRYRSTIEDLVVPDIEEGLASSSGDALGALRECVDALAEPAQRLVRKHYFEGVAYEQLAQDSNRSAGWARWFLFRARAAIARCLEVKGVTRWTTTA